MFNWLSLGKKRTSFGKWLDKREITQDSLAKKAGVSGSTISNMCGDDDYFPKYSTWEKVRRALKNEWGYNVDYEDFWDM